MEELRQEIDQIDQQLVRLFCARMDVSKKIAAYKQEHGLPVYVPQREQIVLKKVAELAGEEYAPYAKELYHTIFRLSRACQGEK